ncbi:MULTISPECIES: ATP-dependent protease LonB [Acidiplasma]|uniref:Archaeal Lon protease n=2 Tax=Acidiplasma TaxID=507753 RepID=A0A0Q0XMG4_9ARCH|nr:MULTISPECIES: ATP-dependent protease LonB [Acidiplasma]KJE49659.1 ATP-dependent protease Lon [Acidiplasma sp. MBA-1]KPV46736.1 ATP-dependent protease Lon [Acidiplasma aeolicum]KQB36681.1 ATP-dependent protease Lon [Acidiplasma aeolicum]KQB36781.1 ATP-dependent protease Lon [Acidiplasma cupricumulans]WMT55780.1 MAG: ATP-dependent protease LonB [Acidiplasma sp.]
MDANNNDVEEWLSNQGIKSTKDIEVPKLLFNQVIGQEKAGEVIKKAAIQKRHVLLIGEPGTGKSMLAQSMVDFLPKEDLEDILCFPNPEDPNKPRIKTFPAGKGKEIVKQYQIKAEREKKDRSKSLLFIVFSIILLGIILAIVLYKSSPSTAIEILFFAIIGAAFIYILLAMNPAAARIERVMVPKILVSHNPNDKPPFIDSTGAHSGALLGDVRHDPFQSGGLETPAHERVEAGNIQKADKGVLFIDEINLLRPEDQQALLTAMQEKKFAISGQSERSAGAMVQTEPVPCDFVLVAAGNLDAIKNMHPALRSRIRGYGYEVYMNDTMDDNDENRRKLVQFVAQEVAKDKKIPPFDAAAIVEIIKEAQKRAGRKGKLTLRLRELGGLVRIAGDIAVSKKEAIVTAEDVNAARDLSKPVEQQIADRAIEVKKLYKMFTGQGSAVGKVNGLAVMGSSEMADFTGVVMPIVAEVTPAQHPNNGTVYATGKLGEIAKEAVQNVAAVIKKISGKNISDMDIHVQFIGTYEGVEGDSASVSIATAIISAIENIPIDQTVAMTGSLSVRGDVLPVGGVTAKVEAAIDSGLSKVIVPLANYNDIILDEAHKDKIEIIAAATIDDVLSNALVKGPEEEQFLEKVKNIIHPVSKEITTSKRPNAV